MRPWMMVRGRGGRRHETAHMLPCVGLMGSVPKVIGLLQIGPKIGAGAECLGKA